MGTDSPRERSRTLSSHFAVSGGFPGQNWQAMRFLCVQPCRLGRSATYLELESVASADNDEDDKDDKNRGRRRQSRRRQACRSRGWPQAACAFILVSTVSCAVVALLEKINKWRHLEPLLNVVGSAKLCHVMNSQRCRARVDGRSSTYFDLDSPREEELLGFLWAQVAHADAEVMRDIFRGAYVMLPGNFTGSSRGSSSSSSSSAAASLPPGANLLVPGTRNFVTPPPPPAAAAAAPAPADAVAGTPSSWSLSLGSDLVGSATYEWLKSTQGSYSRGWKGRGSSHDSTVEQFMVAEGDYLCCVLSGVWQNRTWLQFEGAQFQFGRPSMLWSNILHTWDFLLYLAHFRPGAGNKGIFRFGPTQNVGPLGMAPFTDAHPLYVDKLRPVQEACPSICESGTRSSALGRSLRGYYEPSQ